MIKICDVGLSLIYTIVNVLPDIEVSDTGAIDSGLLSCSLDGTIANPVWDLASSDADGDGVSGITLKDSNFANDLTVNFNLNFR